jgi:hypothetical protein
MALTRLTSANAIPDDSVANVKMANIVQSKNIIINGDMQIAQRSTSTASVTTVGYYTVDRMQWIADYGTVTLSQDTDVPSGYGFANSFKADVTTAGTVVSAGYVLLRQKIEGQNLQYLKKGTSSAQSLTLSFWIKSTKTGTYIAELYDADNTRQISKSYTVSASNTWEKKTITFAGDTTGAFGNDNAASLFVNLYLSAGSDYTSGTLNTSWAASTNANRVVGQVDAQDNTSNNIYFTGIQLEAGDTASEFEFLPFDLNWLRCFRYCLAIGNAPGGTTYNYADNSIIGYYYNGTDFYPNYFYPVPMRATPSVTFSGTGSGLGVVYSDNAGDTTTSNGTNVTSNTNLNFRCSTSQSNQTYGGAFDFSADQYALLSAEL